MDGSTPRKGTACDCTDANTSTKRALEKLKTLATGCCSCPGCDGGPCPKKAVQVNAMSDSDSDG